jgi:hypothetical protein
MGSLEIRPVLGRGDGHYTRLGEKKLLPRLGHDPLVDITAKLNYKEFSGQLKQELNLVSVLSVDLKRSGVKAKLRI